VPIAVHFEHPTMTIEQYDESMRRLDDAGLAAPAGRLVHICYENENRLEILSVWDSQESIDAFVAKLHPLAVESGITDPVFPTVSNVVKLVVAD